MSTGIASQSAGTTIEISSELGSHSSTNSSDRPYLELKYGQRSDRSCTTQGYSRLGSVLATQTGPTSKENLAVW